MGVCRYNILSFFNSFRIVCYKNQFTRYFEPALPNGERQCLSVDNLHLIVPPRLRKNQQTSAGTCPIVSVPVCMVTTKWSCILAVSRTVESSLPISGIHRDLYTGNPRMMLSMMNSDMILKSCKVIMTVYAPFRVRLGSRGWAPAWR